MNSAINRLALLLSLLLAVLAPSTVHAVTPTFLVGGSGTATNPFYGEFNAVPVGKTLVVPIALSGSGPMTYTVTSSSPALQPVIKTGYPVMNVHVSFSGTTGTFNTLYSFTGGNDGSFPVSGLVSGTGGLVGTTEDGGTNGFGTVYQISTSGSLKTLYAFTDGTDGGNPVSTPIGGAGSVFFGTTLSGTTGLGNVYELTITDTATNLHSFTGVTASGTDGSEPVGGLVTGTDGLLYGTTQTGGQFGFGTVYQLAKSGSFHVVYSFQGQADGAYPESTLVQASDGRFFGVATAGGTGAGTIFAVTSAGTLKTIHTFDSASEGSVPLGLVSGSAGLFYGVTNSNGPGGAGAVYACTTGGNLAVLHAFTSGSDGGFPEAGPIFGTDGNLYGTTGTDGSGGFGTLYQVSTTGSFATLHSFTGGADGGTPVAPLIDIGNSLFGTTSTGGTNAHGTVFDMPIPNAGAFSGSMKFALLRDMAPKTSGFIAGFAQAGYYNGLDFFRITDLGSNQFIAQGGDPSNTGTGSPGFSYDNEFSGSLIFDGHGQLAMANSGLNTSTFKGTNGSQFFFTQNPIRSLDYGFTIFGQLISGFDTLANVVSVPLQSSTGGSTSAPIGPVVMDSVTVTEDNQDAVLLVTGAQYLPNGGTIKVNATDQAGNKAVNVTTSATNTGLTFTVTSINDTVNDPPYLIRDPDQNLALHQGVTLPIKPVDLEFDYLINELTPLSESGGSASENSLETQVQVIPFSLSPVGNVVVGLETFQEFVSVNRSPDYDLCSTTIGLGLGNLTPLPVFLTGTAGGMVVSSTNSTVSSTTAGTFLATNPRETPADFTAFVNWGDGTVTSGSNNVKVVNSAHYPVGYDVSVPAGHTYAKPGIYPVDVTVTNSNGGIVDIQNDASVSAGPIYVNGRTFAAPKGAADGLIATFIDHSSNVTAADYTVTINWGDGTITSGSNSKFIHGFGGNFQVYGQHKYAAGVSYPVDVTVNSAFNSSYGWSTAILSGAPAHQPPIAQSHITGQIGNPGFDGLFVDEDVTLVNSGNLPSGPITLKFFLSPDSATSPINPSAIQLEVNKNSTYNTPSIPGGGAIQGTVSKITLPVTGSTHGKFIIMQVITNDPIANHMFYPRAFVDPDPLIE